MDFATKQALERQAFQGCWPIAALSLRCATSCSSLLIVTRKVKRFCLHVFPYAIVPYPRGQMAPSAARPSDEAARPGSRSYCTSMLLLLLVICRAPSSSATRLYGHPLDSLDVDSVDLIEAFEANLRGQLRNLDAIRDSGKSMLEEEDDDMVRVQSSSQNQQQQLVTAVVAHNAM